MSKLKAKQNCLLCHAPATAWIYSHKSLNALCGACCTSIPARMALEVLLARLEPQNAS